MFLHSTRNPEHRVTLSAAITQGIAPDGGLYVPDELPTFSPEDFAGLTELSDVAVRLISPFAKGDALEPVLEEVLSLIHI
jgi:threonine synthase